LFLVNIEYLMLKYLNTVTLIIIFTSVFYSCEENSETPLPEEKNPFLNQVSFIGFELKEKKYETPSAYIEIWSSNDTLSANYDGYLTDGEYDSKLNPPKIKEYSVIVYFDLNSPSLSELAEGTYLFENSNERKPGIFNASSYIRISSDNKTELYNVTSGTINIKEEKGFVLVEYELTVNKEFPVRGQYTGVVEIKNPYLLY